MGLGGVGILEIYCGNPGPPKSWMPPRMVLGGPVERVSPLTLVEGSRGHGCGTPTRHGCSPTWPRPSCTVDGRRVGKRVRCSAHFSSPLQSDIIVPTRLFVTLLRTTLQFSSVVASACAHHDEHQLIGVSDTVRSVLRKRGFRGEDIQ